MTDGLKQLNEVRQSLETSFEELKQLRDNLDTNEQRIINETLPLYQNIRNKIFQLDRLLELKNPH